MASKKQNTPAPLISRAEAAFLPLLSEIRDYSDASGGREVLGYTIHGGGPKDSRIVVGTCLKVQDTDPETGKPVTLWVTRAAGGTIPASSPTVRGDQDFTVQATRKGAKVQGYSTRSESIMRAIAGSHVNR